MFKVILRRSLNDALKFIPFKVTEVKMAHFSLFHLKSRLHWVQLLHLSLFRLKSSLHRCNDWDEYIGLFHLKEDWVQMTH